MLNKMRTAAVAAVFLGVVAGGVGMVARSAPPTPDAPAPDDRATGTDPAAKGAGVSPSHRATMANGATIEVVGVSSHPSGPTTWWRPDGTPLDQAPCDPSGTRISSDQDVVFRAVVARETGLPPDADHGWWVAHSSGSHEPRGGTASRCRA